MWKDNRHFIVYTNTLLSDNDKLSDNKKALITFMVTHKKNLQHNKHCFS